MELDVNKGNLVRPVLLYGYFVKKRSGTCRMLTLLGKRMVEIRSVLAIDPVDKSDGAASCEIKALGDEGYGRSLRCIFRSCWVCSTMRLTLGPNNRVREYPFGEKVGG